MPEYKIYRKYANVSKWSANRPIKNWNVGQPLLNVDADCITDALRQASPILHIGSGLLGAVRVNNFPTIHGGLH